MKISKQSLALAAVLAVCGLFLASCGGGSGGGSSATTINGISVPPEPDATQNNATLAGVDSNANGVRDDVERKIASSVSNKTQYDVNIEIAKEYQSIIAATGSTGSDIDASQKRIACIASNNVALIGDNTKILALTADSSERKAIAKTRISSAGGVVVMDGDCK